MQELLSLVFKSPPADLREFIKWIAEVRRQEDGTPVLSEEEKGRLAVKVSRDSFLPLLFQVIFNLRLACLGTQFGLV